MYASGKHAKGICDRCGLTFKLHELRKEIQDSRLQGLKVCPSCFDPDHPQWKVATAVDHEGLYEPRPDAPDRRIDWGWNPIFGVQAAVELGKVSV